MASQPRIVDNDRRLLSAGALWTAQLVVRSDCPGVAAAGTWRQDGILGNQTLLCGPPVVGCSSRLGLLSPQSPVGGSTLFLISVSRLVGFLPLTPSVISVRVVFVELVTTRAPKALTTTTPTHLAMSIGSLVHKPLVPG